MYIQYPEGFYVNLGQYLKALILFVFIFLEALFFRIWGKEGNVGDTKFLLGRLVIDVRHVFQFYKSLDSGDDHICV